MFRAKLLLVSVGLLHAILMIPPSNSETAVKKTVVVDAPIANLRAGAGIEYEIKATLKEGDQVTVERLGDQWYQVITADRRRGFLHKSLLKLVDETSSRVPVTGSAVKVGGTESKEQSSSAASQVPRAPSQAATTQTAKPAAPEQAPASKDLPTATASKSPSVLQMMEGHENEVMIAAAVGAGGFIIGWIMGGRYYLRRDRTRRNRIRF
jgi:SH3-like domain-containing protein